MSFAHGGRDWSKPLPGCQVHWQHPLAKGLKSLILFNEGAGAPFDLATQEFGVANGVKDGSRWRGSRRGVVGHTTAATDYWLFGSSAIYPTRQATLLLLMEKSDTTNRTAGHIGINGNPPNVQRFGVHVPYSDGVVYWDFGGQTAPNRLSKSGLTVSGLNAWAFVAGSRGMAIYQNGKLANSSSTAVTRTASTASYCVNQANNATGDICDFHMAAVLDAEWTQEMVEEWVAEPFLFTARAPTVYFLVTAPVVPDTADSYAPEVTVGPAVPGAPWIARFPVEPVLSQAPAAAPALQAIAGEVETGPPLFGAPWMLRMPYIPPLHVLGPQPVIDPTDPQPHMPEVVAGPPMVGAPWMVRLPVLDVLYQPPPLAALEGVQTYAPEIFHGPPIPGAPWFVPFFPPALPPTHPPPPIDPNVSLAVGRLKPFIARDPLSDPRIRRFTEAVSAMLNSLLGNGYIEQIAPGQFILPHWAFVHTRQPLPSDDNTVNARVGSTWVDTTTGIVYYCTNADTNSAVWVRISQ